MDMKYLLVLILLLGASCSFVSGQAPANDRKGPVAVTTCEHLKHALDYSLIDSRGDDKAYVYLVFRPGKKEKSSSYSGRRTRFILKYLKFRDEKFDRLLISHREPVANLGKLEISVKGTLKWEIYFRKNTTRWNSCIE